ncbi:MAG TPA: sugar ABC transporter ATP-binding protein [Clostridiales bacterium]|nr:sugar ABC transporter ATP-binding protein [Clostridiales bacterium]
MKNISKSFPGVQALKNVSFDLKKGEVHALVGENGAGKSTLMKVLGGVHLADEGEIEINGVPVEITSPRDALDHNISVIHQEFNLVPTLNVYENVFLGKELIKKTTRSIDRKLMREKTKELLESLGLTIIGTNYDIPVRNLSVAQQQLVEIAKALFNETNILVMDEPTSVLTSKETEILFELINKFKEEGMAIVYISHRLEEVITISDRITVLRDGELITTMDNSDKNVSKDEIVAHMIGRNIEDYYPDRSTDKINGDVVLEVKNLTAKGIFDSVSFNVRKGEILGFAGLVGAGRTEIMKAIFGDFHYNSGEIILDGVKKRIRSTTEAIKEGIVLVPEDRKQEGLVLLMTLADNISLPNTDKITSLGTVRRKKKTSLANEFVEKLAIRPPMINRPIQNFSGGNQQKTVIAKWLATNPKLIILDEPTRGVDVGAKSEIYSLVNDLTKAGVGIVFVSSELPELLGVCDRILVVHEGRISGEFRKEEATEEKILRAAAGMEN